MSSTARTTAPAVATGLVLTLALCFPASLVTAEARATSAVAATLTELTGPPTCC